MNKTVEGKFYTWFEDETWEEALNNHNIEGFTDIQWALLEACDTNTKVPFKIVDHNKNVILDSKNFEWEHLELRARCTPNRFYSKIGNESLAQAIENHSQGFTSVEDAVNDAENDSGEKGESYEIYNHELKMVHKGTVK